MTATATVDGRKAYYDEKKALWKSGRKIYHDDDDHIWRYEDTNEIVQENLHFGNALEYIRYGGRARVKSWSDRAYIMYDTDQEKIMLVTDEDGKKEWNPIQEHLLSLNWFLVPKNNN